MLISGVLCFYINFSIFCCHSFHYHKSHDIHMRNGEMGKCERVMNRQTESEIYGGIFTHGHKVKI